MNFKKLVSVAVATTMLMGSTSFAAIPENTLVAGAKAYDMTLLFNAAYTQQINAAANAAGGALYYNSGSGWKNLFTDEALTDFSGWPQIMHVNAAGATTLYAAGNGTALQQELAYMVGNEILIDGTDGDPNSDNYIVVTFNKPLVAPGNTNFLDSYIEGENKLLMVNGETDIGNIFDVVWDQARPNELMLYIAGAAKIPSPSEISFKFNYGAIKATDGSTLSEEALAANSTVVNTHFGE